MEPDPHSSPTPNPAFNPADGTRWIRVGAVLAGLAVAMGAFAAHGLDTVLPEMYLVQTKIVAGETVPAARKYLADFRTAAEYQMSHALGILLLGLMMERNPCGRLRVAAWCLLLGIVLFSGSLYVLVLTGRTWLGAITPFGGVLFLIGWFYMALHARKAFI